MQNTTILRCECCGADMDLAEDRLTATCPYCRHKVLFREPKSDAVIQALTRATGLRLDNLFSDAIREYKLLVDGADATEDAEALWGMVLSEYGITYVKDRNGVQKPTCNRMLRKSILEDKYYRRALAAATPDQRADYERQAAEIDRLQKSIVRRTDAGEDYDIFISFKSTDERGFSTRDAQIARTLYDELQKRGFKTFFSDVTLDEVSGADYEPIIFRALYSCKFFVLVATQETYVNAPWVANEWSRFELRMEEEKLAGCACAVFDRPLTASELPKIFRGSQGVDLARHPMDYAVLLADNIERMLGRSKKSLAEEEIKRQIEEQKKQQRELEEKLRTMQTGGGSGTSASVAALLKRGKQEYEAGDPAKASEYFTRALDIDPECAEGWWGLWLLDRDARSDEDFFAGLTVDTIAATQENRNYHSALQYAKGDFAEYVQAFDAKMTDKVESLLPGLQRELQQHLQNSAEAQRKLQTDLAQQRAKREEAARKSAELQSRLSEMKEYAGQLKILSDDYASESEKHGLKVPCGIICFLAALLIIPALIATTISVIVGIVAGVLLLVVGITLLCVYGHNKRKDGRMKKDYDERLLHLSDEIPRVQADTERQKQILENLEQMCAATEQALQKQKPDDDAKTRQLRKQLDACAAFLTSRGRTAPDAEEEEDEYDPEIVESESFGKFSAGKLAETRIRTLEIDGSHVLVNGQSVKFCLGMRHQRVDLVFVYNGIRSEGWFSARDEEDDEDVWYVEDWDFYRVDEFPESEEVMKEEEPKDDSEIGVSESFGKFVGKKSAEAPIHTLEVDGSRVLINGKEVKFCLGMSIHKNMRTIELDFVYNSAVVNGKYFGLDTSRGRWVIMIDGRQDWFDRVDEYPNS